MKCLLFIYVCFLFGNVLSTNFTFTYNMALRCKEYLCQHGYSYKNYFFTEAYDRKLVKSDSSIVFEMHLAILAASNGHILLSSVPAPTTEPVYEIVIGGGANKFTELRRNLRRNAKASAKTVGVLSPVEFRAFYIKISEEGLIEFGKEGDSLPLLTYMDMDPIPVKYFSFAAWNGVEAKFLYDCPIPGDASEVTPNSEAIDPKLSNSDKLKRVLLLDRNPMIPPSSEVVVNLGVRINSVSYDAFESKLSTGLSMVMTWTDQSMAWDLAKFNNVTSLKFRQGQIWSPSFHTYNSDAVSMLDAKNPELITMVNSGEATYHMQTSVNTWCFDYTTTMTRWPRDEYTCAIVIEPWQAHEKILLKQLDQNTAAMKVFSELDDVILNIWEVSSSQHIVSSASWNLMYTSDDNTTHRSDRFAIKMSIKRRATAYNIVFYTPLLVLVTFLLLSFWTETLCLARVWFYAGCSIIICMGLCYIDFLVPCHTVPTILILYTAVLGGILLALLIQVALMTSLAERLARTIVMQNVLTAQWFRSLFCLPPLKDCRIYETINEDLQEEDEVPTPRNLEQMQTDNVQHSEVRELAEITDKTLFFIYSVAFSVMLSLHF
ncbi:neuronal acetylcholine receptor subunit eat-2 [Pieris napi]|uniref:neuronal acetylcholine receptor subunit eat-2 n=1 Tax=Pieris napi TaxID=78633 RepID=UPI001FB8DEB2|nr:neuronal acetylcholine receptor subunit eat-2 [Pieris napi]